MAYSLKMLCFLAVLLTASRGLPLPRPARLPWQPHQFSVGPIVVPGVSFPPGFPFPVSYPLPAGFPYTPFAYQNILPSLVAQFNAALAATANNVAAATASVLATFAPNYNYRPV